MQVFIDMDGVIVDFVRGAHKFHGIDGVWPYPRGVWDFVPLTGLSDAEFWEPLGFKFWSELHWTSDGHRIWDMVAGHSPAIITTPTLHLECPAGKMQWIRNHLPDMYRRTVITAAKEVCAHPNALLIDDNDQNVDKWRACGGVAILVPRIWNSRHAECDDTVEILYKEISDAGIGSVL